jgi:hypothetical protein
MELEIRVIQTSEANMKACNATWIPWAIKVGIKVVPVEESQSTSTRREYESNVFYVNDQCYVHPLNLMDLVRVNNNSTKFNMECNNVFWPDNYTDSSATKTKLIRGCNHAGLIGYANCCEGTCSISYTKTAVLGSMTPEALEVYHNNLEGAPQYPKTPTPDNKWSLVVGYFDLTTRSDNNTASRSFEHYMQHSRVTLGLNQNLIIFCEPKSYPLIYGVRKEYGLLSKTKFYVMQLDDFPFSMYYQKIIENRKKQNYTYDSRNTASYYTLMCAKYTMMQMAILNNPFASTHFGWINICISRMGLRNAEMLTKALAQYRDKFSTLYIDYCPESIVRNVPEYYKWGRCTMCSGFYTGSKYYMYRVASLIEKKFVDTVEAGYGHADEQLYSAVYFDHPELFQHYYGDYQQMITNYCGIIENPYTTLNHIIPNSSKFGNYQVSYLAAKAVYDNCVGPNAIIELQPQAFIKALDCYFETAMKSGHEAEADAMVNWLSSTCDNNPTVLVWIRQNGAHLVRKTDSVYKGETQVIHTTSNQDFQMPDTELTRLRMDNPDKKIIVYGNYQITGKSFITSNPVLRPALQ